MANSQERLYYVWWGIIARCEYPSATGYKYYGEKGIKVCEEWHDYENFKKWAFENGYDPDAPYGKFTIERKDNSKDYCPENCVWANKITQANNTTRNVYYTYNGETLSISQWAHKIDMDEDLLWQRLRVYNSPFEKAILKQDLDNHYITYNNETHNIKEWAEILNIKQSTLSSRLNKQGWSVEKAFTTPVKPRKNKDADYIE